MELLNIFPLLAENNDNKHLEVIMDKEFMEFKKPPQSYWISPAEDTNFPTLDKDLKTDLLIIGGGMAGISTAYQLINKDLDIVIIDSKKIVQGTTAHTTAKITSQHGLIYDKFKKSLGESMARQYAESNEFAIKEIKKIIDENNIDCDYKHESAYIYTQKEEFIENLKKEAEAASSFGIKASYVNELPLNLPIKGALKFEDQAQFHPRKYMLGLTKAITESGVQIFEHTRAVELDQDDDDNYIITTDNGCRITANKVVIATHYPFYNKHRMYFSKIYQERSYIVAIKGKEKFPGGMYINAEEPSRSLRGIYADGNELILVVGEDHKTGQGEDTNDHYKSLINFASDVFTIEEIPFRWSTQDCMTLDGIPYIGQYSVDTLNLYIATGFQKWGMTNGTVSSIILRDLILNNENPWLEVYSPSRKTTMTAAKEFVVQNANVAGQLIDGKLEMPPKNIEILPGQGKVIEVDGKRAGAYRDEEGKLHLVNTTCTHMGCELNWNGAELSWDCPCHGSRFTIDGDVIDGPAVSPLSFDEDVNIFEKLINEDF